MQSPLFYQTGAYLGAADAPFDQRALPPNALTTDPNFPDYPYNYHIYTVMESFEVVAGPIAPWFGQPGYGTQFFIGGVGDIKKLLEDGYLEESDITAVKPGSGEGAKYG
ncbi:MAG: hypothetical protein Q9168_004632 [Polycauliona sp. 1 TL-2023]